MTSGIETLRHFVIESLGWEKYELVVIDNSVTTGVVERNDDFTLVPGDNTELEFSGWRAGYDYLKSNYSIKRDDLVLFANDTFHRNYGIDYLEGFKDVDVKKGQDFIAGVLNDFPGEVAIDGYVYQTWIRTSLFLANVKIVESIYPFYLSYQNHEIFSEDYSVFFKKDGIISERLQKYLNTWLFKVKNDEGFSYVWHSAHDGFCTSENAEFFRRKTRAIISEHTISIRAREAGADFINVNKQINIKKPGEMNRNPVLYKNKGYFGDIISSMRIGVFFEFLLGIEICENQFTKKLAYIRDSYKPKYMRCAPENTFYASFSDHNQRKRMVMFFEDPLERYLELLCNEEIKHPLDIKIDTMGKAGIANCFQRGLEADGKEIMWNYQTRMLCGKIDSKEKISIEDYKFAVNVLNSLESFGLSGRFNASLELLKNRLSLNIYGQRKINSKLNSRNNVFAKAKSYIDDNALQIFEEKNEYDIKLYNYAEELLLKRYQTYCVDVPRKRGFIYLVFLTIRFIFILLFGISAYDKIKNGLKKTVRGFFKK